jgi:LemA protein
VGLLLGFGTCGVSSYNNLVTMDQRVQSQWAQVENVYQRRADLIPNLVETVKGAASFEKETLLAVTEARAKVGRVAGPGTTSNAEAFQKFQQAQDGLSGAISRLLVVAEAYPQLTATQGFRDLQAQLEGSENRITVERMRFNEAAQVFNSARSRFPTMLFASFFGDRFQTKQYFRAQIGAEQTPKVKF